MSFRPATLLAPSSLPDDVWHERHRWLLGILWVHVAIAGVYAAVEGHLSGSAGPFVVPALLCAALASLPPRARRHLPARIRSTGVAIGLLSASVAMSEMWAGSAEAAFHTSLLIVLLMLYEDRNVLVLAVAFVAAQFAVRGVPLHTAAIHTLLAAGVAFTAIVVVRLNANLRSDAQRATQRFRSSFDDAPIGMAVVSPEGRLIDVNPALCNIVGYSQPSLLARNIQDITLPEDLAEDGDLVRMMLRSKRRTSHQHLRFLHADGSAVWVSLRLSLVTRGDGEPDHLIVQVEDIADRKRGEERLQHLADHDPLTGLMNRRRIEGEIAQQIRLAERYRRRSCLIMLDLDKFKPINDTVGHAAGDELLKGIGDVLRERVRRSDMVARLGGDEFAILLPQASREQAMLVAQGIGQAIRERVCITAGSELHTTASMGVAAIETDDSPGRVLLRADQAMYAAKTAGRDRIVVAGPPFVSRT
jgi:diguanylate cyclase (GGDEF)-like protein/PAS domain S-box-containing protein